MRGSDQGLGVGQGGGGGAARLGVVGDVGYGGCWLVGWLILNVPVNNFSVMGWSHHFLGVTSTFGE